MSVYFKIRKAPGCWLVLLFTLTTACKKFVQDPVPSTEIAAATVFSTNNSAAAAMTGIYANMINGQGLSDGVYSISLLDGLAADELINYGPYSVYQQFYANALSSETQGSSNGYFWQEIYADIYQANAVIAGVNGSTGITAAMKQQLIGEAEFTRAFFYFYAVNLYGDVPLALSTSYQVNTSLHRSPKAVVLQQVIADLTDAQSKLSSNFVNYQGLTTTERTRPNKGAATALLARAYLYEATLNNNPNYFSKTDSAASAVIGNNQYGLVTNLNNVFLANSSEAIWQLQPVEPGVNTQDAQQFVLTSTPGTGQFQVALSTFLLKAFEPNDQRYVNWVGSFTDPSSSITYYYPYKYKVWQYNQPVTEYQMVLRLAEQYLIRAEAEANGAGGGLGAAIADLNIIRSRAGLPNYAGAMDKASVLAAILHESQVEFFTEWGHRWFDLNRTGNLNSVMGSPGNVCQAKGGTWNPNWALVPLPSSELLVNRNLTQNPGY